MKKTLTAICLSVAVFVSPTALATKEGETKAPVTAAAPAAIAVQAPDAHYTRTYARSLADANRLVVGETLAVPAGINLRGTPTLQYGRDNIIRTMKAHEMVTVAAHHEDAARTHVTEADKFVWVKVHDSYGRTGHAVFGGGFLAPVK